MAEKNQRVKRLMDLFTEGDVLQLGFDGSGDPILVWVNKLNSFEEEETRRDGTTARSARMADLSRLDSPERAGMLAEIRGWRDEQLASEIVLFRSDEIYLRVLNDLDADEKFAEMRERMQRLPELLDDAGVDDNDDRRRQLIEDQQEWTNALQERHKKAVEEAEADEMADRKTMEERYIELWRDRTTIDSFINEKRLSTIYRAMRSCVATDVSTGGHPKWDHSGCNHLEFYLEERAEVRQLPDAVIQRVTEKLEQLTVGPRAAGNSVAPTSSSGSLESPRSEEESAPSTPEATPSVVPTT